MKEHNLDAYVDAGCEFYKSSRAAFTLVFLGTNG